MTAGIIKKLATWKKLTLIGSFKKWGEGKNATLSELNYLSSLTKLRIEMEGASLAAEQIYLLYLEDFDIRIGNPTVLFHTSRKYRRKMQLLLENKFILGDWVHQLLESSESLILQGEGSSKLVSLFLPRFHCLKRLLLQNTKMTRLSDGRSSGTTTVFPILESLCLKDIKDFEEIDNVPISSDSFKNLQKIVLVSLPKLRRLWNVVTPLGNITSIHIAKCDSLRSLFPLDKAGDYLLRLQRIIIRSRSMLKQIVLQNNEENGQSKSRMRNLQLLDLQDLRRFTSLYKGLDSIHFTFNSQQSERTTAD